MNLIRLLAVLGLLLAPSPLFAEAIVPSPVSADTRVSQRQVTIGDVVTYSIIVRHDDGIHVAPPDPTAHFNKGFEYVDRGTLQPKTIDGQTEETFWFKYRADQVGFYNLPKIPIEFAVPSPDNPSQSIPGTINAPESVIEIRSVLFIDKNANDIKDIKPIIGAGSDWQKYLSWIVSGLAALLGLAGLFWWLSRREKPPAPKVPRVPDLKAYEVALAELDQLVARHLLENGQFREHYFELSEIFRRYLGTLLSIPALDWTTEEIGDYVTDHGSMAPGQRQILLALLPATDQIKFAQAPVALDTAHHHVEAVRNFIRSTTPEITSKYQVKPTTAA